MVPPYMPELESATRRVDLEIKMFGKCASTWIGHGSMQAPMSAVASDGSMESILMETDLRETLNVACADAVMSHQCVPRVSFDELLDDHFAVTSGSAMPSAMPDKDSNIVISAKWQTDDMSDGELAVALVGCFGTARSLED